jgi:integrase
MTPARRTPGVTRRTNADGSTVYGIRWRQGGGREARNLSHTFRTQKEALDARSRIISAGSICHCPKHAPGPAARAPGLLPDEHPAKVLTFGEYAERHAASLTGVGEGYRRDMVRDLRRHLQPFADLPLDGITSLAVREWIRGMETGTHPWLTRPLSTTTVRRNLAQAGAVMAAAVNDGKATRNAFRGHRLARHEQTQDAGMTFLTSAEWRLLEQHLPEGVYRDLCGFLVGSGLRWGEATALNVGDVDVLASPPRVHVGRAWKKDGKGGVVLGAPKSARSRRTVPIAGWVRDLLIPHVAGKADDELVFTTAYRGRPLLHSNFYSKVWLPAVERAQAAGLEKRPRVHDLRHTFVSWSLAAGVSLSEVSRRVGHQSATITDARYSHLMPESEANFSEAMERYRTRDA